eukprot:3454959-Prymnesium_polylepis.1
MCHGVAVASSHCRSSSSRCAKCTEAHVLGLPPSQLEAKAAECEGLRAQADRGGLVRELQAKLQAAESDLARLVAEREKLMEISNMLRADLNR